MTNEEIKTQANKQAISERAKMVKVLDVIIADQKAGLRIDHSKFIQDVKNGKVVLS